MFIVMLRHNNKRRNIILNTIIVIQHPHATYHLLLVGFLRMNHQPTKMRSRVIILRQNPADDDSTAAAIAAATAKNEEGCRHLQDCQLGELHDDGDDDVWFVFE